MLMVEILVGKAMNVLADGFEVSSIGRVMMIGVIASSWSHIISMWVVMLRTTIRNNIRRLKGLIRAEVITWIEVVLSWIWGLLIWQ